MKFAIITHVSHLRQGNSYFAYGPYIKEMNIWLQNVDQAIIVAPLKTGSPKLIDLKYESNSIRFNQIKNFNTIGFLNKITTLFLIPKIAFTIFKVMKEADHIHLRCPGNVGLIGCFVQILFPKKPKSAKYAGNWDPRAKQPLSYKLQKWILSNTFLTKKMQVLVYGEWENQSRNVKSFFTASYSESDKQEILDRNLNGTIKILFVGTLSSGKRPLYALQLVTFLKEIGFHISLDFFGDGNELPKLSSFVLENNLQNNVSFHGNQASETVLKAYQNSHFLILPSQSEGWPKVVAEAMFWGCIPVASDVSCVRDMLGSGYRGLILTMDLQKDIQQIQELFNDNEKYQAIIKNGVEWSREYTLDTFEIKIAKILRLQ